MSPKSSKPLSFVLALAFLGTACASLQVESGDPPVRKKRWWSRSADSEGVPFYLSKPYLLVEPALPGTAPEMRVVYLPDYSKPFRVKPKGWLGAGGFQIALEEGAVLRSIAFGAVTSTAPPATSVSLPGLAPSVPAGVPRASAPPLDPGLYELEFKGGQLTGLRHVPLPSGNTALAATPLVRDIRFVAHPGSPEVPLAVVITLEGATMPPCPPPGLSVEAFRNNEPLTLCGGPSVSCDPTAQEVRCPVTGPVQAARYLVRASSQALGAKGISSSAEKRFPETADGFSAFEPQADISFGKDPDGKIQTIAVTFDPRSGSCVQPHDSIIRVSAGGNDLKVKTHYQVQPGGKQGDCLTDLVLHLHKPQPEVSVTVQPRNLSGLQGKTKFASAAAPPPPSSPSKAEVPAGMPQYIPESPIYVTQMNVVPTSAKAGGGPETTPNPQPVDQRETAIRSARGNLEGSSFSDVALFFTAKPEDIVRLPKVAGWVSETGSGGARGRALQVNPPQACSRDKLDKQGKRLPPPTCSQDDQERQFITLNREITSISEISPGQYQAQILLKDEDRDSTRKRVFCLEVRFHTPQGDQCQVLILDESVLHKREENPKTTK